MSTNKSLEAAAIEREAAESDGEMKLLADEQAAAARALYRALRRDGIGYNDDAVRAFIAEMNRIQAGR